MRHQDDHAVCACRKTKTKSRPASQGGSDKTVALADSGQKGKKSEQEIGIVTIDASYGKIREVQCGEVRERLNRAVSKTVEPLRVPWVRIPPSPPDIRIAA